MHNTTPKSLSACLFAGITLLLASTASAAGTVKVVNRCPQPIYINPVDSQVNAELKLNSGQEYTEFFHVDARIGDNTLKVTLVPGGMHTAGVPQTIVSYILKGDTIEYSLGEVYGSSGVQSMIVPSYPDCQTILKPTGNGAVPTGETCRAKTDLTWTFCPFSTLR